MGIASATRYGALCAALGALLLAGAPLGAQMGPTPDSRAPLPSGEGRDLVAVACSQCHGLGTIMSLRDGPEGWKRFVQEMVMRGAQLNPQEADTAVKYLASHFGPSAGPMPGATVAGRAMALPEGAGKDLVQARCTACHTLARITDSRRTGAEWDRTVQDMVSRGANVSPGEAQTITSYLSAQFGRKGE